MFRVSIVLLSFSLLFISCNNDDDNSSPPIEEANFYALTIGNSWEYEYFKRNNQLINKIFFNIEPLYSF